MLRLHILLLIIAAITLSGCATPQAPRPDAATLPPDQNYLHLTDGTELFERQWAPESKADAVIIMLHGSGSHSGGLSHLAEYLATHAFHVYAYDYPGFGYSPGRRAITPPFAVLQRGLSTYLTLIRNRHPGLAIFIVGESMGGSMAIYSEIYSELDAEGIILCGAAFDYPPGTNAFLRFIARFIGFFSEDIPLVPVELDELTRSEEAKARFLADPLMVTDRIPVGHVNVLMDNINRMRPDFGKVQIPFYIQHGSEDHVAPLSGVEDLYRLAASKDKKMKIYPGLMHAILHEPEWLNVADDMIEWISLRMETEKMTKTEALHQ